MTQPLLPAEQPEPCTAPAPAAPATAAATNDCPGLTTSFQELCNYASSNAPELTFAQLVPLLLQKIRQEINPSSEPQTAAAAPGPPLESQTQAKVQERLSQVTLLNPSEPEDPIAAAWQAFQPPRQRRRPGQFFTPRNVAQLMLELLEPPAEARIIDPAAGSGALLAAAAAYRRQRYSDQTGYQLVGMERDRELAQIAQAYLQVLHPSDSQVLCRDSLTRTETWPKPELLTTFDCLLANPPYGAKVPVQDPELVPSTFPGNRPTKLDPAILFAIGCQQLLKPGGRMALILPDGVLANPSSQYFRDWLGREMTLYAVISLPPETFQPHTHVKTSIVFLENRPPPAPEHLVFIGIAENIGKDRKGRPAAADDLPEIAQDWQRQIQSPAANRKTTNPPAAATLQPPTRQLRQSSAWLPARHDPGMEAELNRLRESGDYDLISLGQLVEQGILEIKRGREIGAEHYGTGSIPFIRSSDLGNWEIRADPLKGVSRELYEKYAPQQDVQAGDLLLVCDGTHLIGRSAVITRLDTTILYQSHLKKLRVLKPEILDPYLLFHMLNGKIIRRQFTAKTYTQGTISTLGSGLLDIMLPVPQDPERGQAAATRVAAVIERKTAVRERMQRLLELEL